MGEYTVMIRDDSISAPRVVRVGSHQDTLSDDWVHMNAPETVTAHTVTADTPVQALVRAAEEVFHPEYVPELLSQWPTITLEAQGVLSPPPVDRTELQRLCAQLPRPSEDPMLYCSLDATGAILEHGTHEHVRTRMAPDHTLIAARSMDTGDSSAPLAELWTGVLCTQPGLLGPLPAMVNVLDDVAKATDGIQPLFDATGLLQYLRAASEHNATGQRPRISLRCYLGLDRVQKDLPTLADLEGFHHVFWDAPWGQRQTLGPLEDGHLYRLPEAISGWRLVGPCGLCAPHHAPRDHCPFCV